jgi:hypothetical protein
MAAISIGGSPMKQTPASSNPVPADKPESPVPLPWPAPIQHFVQVHFDFESIEKEGDTSCEQS